LASKLNPPGAIPFWKKTRITQLDEILFLW
jgi:hypothetical protein